MRCQSLYSFPVTKFRQLIKEPVQLDLFEWVNLKYVSRDGNDLSGSSSKVSETSVPMTPQTEGEILQSSNVKSFSFSDLKSATRNFHPDSVLGEGGFGSVFKGWIDEHTFAATKSGTGVDRCEEAQPRRLLGS